LKTIGKVIPHKPSVEMRAYACFSSMLSPVAIDVIDGEKLKLLLTTTGTKGDFRL